MKTTRILAVVVVVVVLALMGGAAQKVWASPPDITRGTSYLTHRSGFWSNHCGFDVTRHVEGFYTDITQERVDGAIRYTSIEHATLTLSGNGNEVHGRFEGPYIVTVYPDESWTVRQAGQQDRYLIPGQGLVWGGSGSLYLEFDAYDNLVFERWAGPGTSDTDAICAELAQ